MKKPKNKKKAGLIILTLANILLCLVLTAVLVRYDGIKTEKFFARYSCREAVCCRLDDGKILFSRKKDKIIAPASLTKLLTACTALDSLSGDSKITVGSEINLVGKNSSLCGIKHGQVLTLRTLIDGMLLESGNDAAYTVAAASAKYLRPEKNFTDSEAVSYFCSLMNKKAKKIGMRKSRFKNPDGYDCQGHYSTAADLLRLSEYALTVPEIAEAAGKSKKNEIFVSGEYVSWKNSNKLLDKSSAFYCPDAIGMKTGTTPQAGKCISAAFRRNGSTYIIITLGSETDSGRYDAVLKLYQMCRKASAFRHGDIRHTMLPRHEGKFILH